jgi:hypothetical protein
MGRMSIATMTYDPFLRWCIIVVVAPVRVEGRAQDYASSGQL